MARLGMDPDRADQLVEEFSQAETAVKEAVLKLHRQIETITTEKWWEGSDAGRYQTSWTTETNKVNTLVDQVMQACIAELNRQKEQQETVSGQ